MPSLITIKSSDQSRFVPTVAELEFGEMAINIVDGQIFYKQTAYNVGDPGNPFTHIAKFIGVTSLNAEGVYKKGDIVYTAEEFDGVFGLGLITDATDNDDLDDVYQTIEPVVMGSSTAMSYSYRIVHEISRPPAKMAGESPGVRAADYGTCHIINPNSDDEFFIEVDIYDFYGVRTTDYLEQMVIGGEVMITNSLGSMTHFRGRILSVFDTGSGGFELTATALSNQFGNTDDMPIGIGTFSYIRPAIQTVPAGGVVGESLVKTGANDFETEWQSNADSSYASLLKLGAVTW